MLDKMPCSIRLVRVPRTDAAFHDFDDYERLLKAAQAIDPRSYLIALLGGEAGLRAGEIVALEWADVDLERRQIRVRHSDWCGELTAPKNGRIQFVGMTERQAGEGADWPFTSCVTRSARTWRCRARRCEACRSSSDTRASR